MPQKGAQGSGLIPGRAGTLMRDGKGGESMCEAHAFVLEDDREVKLLESVDELEVNGEEIRLVSIFGEQKIIKGKLKRYNNSERKILLEPVQ